MRYFMALAAGCSFVLSIAAPAAFAGPREDCASGTLNPELVIEACSKLIKRAPRDAILYDNRGNGYARKDDFDSAIADFSEAIRLSPNHGLHISRGAAYLAHGDYDLAIADLDEAIRLKPGNAFAHYGRGAAYRARRDYDRAIADYNEAIRLNPNHAASYSSRGYAYAGKGDHDRAIIDLNKALKLKPDLSGAYGARGYVFHKKGHHDRAVADLTEAIRLDPKEVTPYVDRGEVYEAKGDRAKAIEDYAKALALPAKYKWHRDKQAEARRRLATLQAPPPAPPPTAPPPPPVAAAPPKSVSLGRRVALVIGNAAYRNVKALPNPVNDARAVAAALRAAGFAEVVERYDLGVQDMQKALKAFESMAIGADWAVVYYAGHGIEVDGRNFLIPVDAELKSASDVEDETVALDRVMARVGTARRLQLVILDACRDNPFVPRMAQVGGIARAVGTRGLARIEPAHPNLFVAYSARHGEVALDGTGSNSPYARALVKHLATPGLELGIFFRRVRTEVLADTGGKQRPFEYGSLTDENLFFRPPPR